MSDIKRYTSIDKFDLPDIIDIVNQRYEIGKQYAKARALHSRYELGQDSVLAKLMEEQRRAPIPEGKRTHTIDDLKAKARATPEWVEYTIKVADAFELMLDLQNERDTLDMAFEALRSRMANEREANRRVQ
jgi:aromatic ring-opening dioxygenase catalytic subunit (LigB family)